MNDNKFLFTLILVGILVLVLAFNIRAVNTLKRNFAEINKSILTGFVCPTDVASIGSGVTVRLTNVGMKSVDLFIFKYAFISNKIVDGMKVLPSDTKYWATDSVKRSFEIVPAHSTWVSVPLSKDLGEIPDHKHLVLIVDSPNGMESYQIYNYTDGFWCIQDKEHFELADVFQDAAITICSLEVKDYQGKE